MVDFLYRWPDSAWFGSRVPKEKFYERGVVNQTVRGKFVSEVQRITWSYKLAESTINLSGTDAVHEVQVFTIDAKNDDVSEAVLSAIDKAIPFPIIFELTRQVRNRSEVRMTAAHKQLGTGAPKLSAYYSTEWQPADTSRQNMPTAITLSALYGALLQPLTPLASRDSADMSGLADRLAAVQKLKKEVTALERKLNAERQFNRKVELRRALQSKQQELTVLVEG